MYLYTHAHTHTHTHTHTHAHIHSHKHPQVRWKFNDLTHGRSLTAVINTQLPDNSHGKLYLVQLWDETSPQRLDVGASVLAVAEAMTGTHQVSWCGWSELWFVFHTIHDGIDLRVGCLLYLQE